MFMPPGLKNDPDPKNVVITKLFAPKFCAEWSNREVHSSHGDPIRENPKCDPDRKNVVITKLFAPKFCEECTGRELHSSHGNPFRDNPKN